ncbi:HPP family protein [Noviherbaspirillum autotrophicum]|uniref:HPP transmembrane region domain-containing protein n=1 Tax=Noviherbaspirillum autotrophicum TaxID=709839 RepID=A0A0C1XYV7_9BURK|nr:HPP family protein [Noviherbaspirillum autotrophicum]KIF79943.1 hypothetical protein TSA66_02460 [Noviherbaspirillum autotrophicum]
MNKLPRRRRIGLKGELALALMPTAIVLLVLVLVEALSRQRLLFASLASSAFLIYLDPENAVNKVRTLVLSQVGAAALGLLAFMLLGPGYLSGGIAMVIAIVGMIAFDAMHPPAVSTALSFGLRASDESNLMLFALAVGITALLIGMQKSALWMLRRME